MIAQYPEESLVIYIYTHIYSSYKYVIYEIIHVNLFEYTLLIYSIYDTPPKLEM